MRIGILYTSALRQRAGIGRYTRGLVNALARLNTPHQYTLVISRDSPPEKIPPLPANFTVKQLPLPEKWLTILWHRLNLPLAIDRWAGPFDLFHAPDFVLPPLHRTPGLLTVHDLSFLKHPQGAVPKLRRWLMRVVPQGVSRARHILADSCSTRADLADWLNVPADKITVIGAGVESRFQPITDAQKQAAVRTKYQLPPEFVLALGTLEPRKNFTGVIEAFNEIQAGIPDLHLVIAGGKGWLYESIFEAAANSPARDKIHFIGFVADEDLPTLYSLAHIFAYPSFYEGFGIPVLEAMACGTPVVTANNSSLPEVAGQAALLANADNTAELGAAIRRLATRPDLHRQYRQLGLSRAAQFTWEEAAHKLVTVYNRFTPAA